MGVLPSPQPRPLQQDPATGDHQTEPALLNRVVATTGNTTVNASTATIVNIAMMLDRLLRPNKSSNLQKTLRRNQRVSPRHRPMSPHHQTMNLPTLSSASPKVHQFLDDLVGSVTSSNEALADLATNVQTITPHLALMNEAVRQSIV